MLAGTAPLQPGRLHAQPTAAGDSTAFDSLFLRGDEQYSRREFLAAARTWTAATQHLRTDDSDNRRDLYDYIAEAYEKAAAGGEERVVVEEAVTLLDHYVADFSQKYPGVGLNARGVSAHERLRARVVSLTPSVVTGPPSTRSVIKPPLLPTSPSRSWKGLALAGGVATGLGVSMLGVALGGVVRSRALERQFDEMCPLETLQGTCQDIYDRGRRVGGLTVGGLIVAPLVVGAGITAVVVAVRRRDARQRLQPVLSPTTVGAVWRWTF